MKWKLSITVSLFKSPIPVSSLKVIQNKHLTSNGRLPACCLQGYNLLEIATEKEKSSCIGWFAEVTVLQGSSFSNLQLCCEFLAQKEKKRLFRDEEFSQIQLSDCQASVGGCRRDVSWSIRAKIHDRNKLLTYNYLYMYTHTHLSVYHRELLITDLTLCTL